MKKYGSVIECRLRTNKEKKFKLGFVNYGSTKWNIDGIEKDLKRKYENWKVKLAIEKNKLNLETNESNTE